MPAVVFRYVRALWFNTKHLTAWRMKQGNTTSLPQKVGEAGAVAVAPVGFQPAVLKKSHLFKVHK